VRGYWNCYTKGCHKKHGSNLVGFIKGVLTNQQHKDITSKDAINWLVEFNGFTQLDEIPLPDNFILDRRRQTIRDYYFNGNQDNHSKKKLLNKWQARQKIKVPSQYYLKRGYSKEILERYDVGEAGDRVVVPVYNMEYEGVIGSTSRSIHDQCTQCKLWHSPAEQCPSKKKFGEFIHAAKWFNKNFDKGNSLYNLWHNQTKKAIEKHGRVIIVEGPGDIWKLEEAGIHNCVAMYGVELSDSQTMLLYEHFVHQVALLLDNDKAGKYAIDILQDRLKREFMLFTGDYASKDIGETNSEDINSIQLIDNKSRPYMTLKEFAS
jgi:5S rRNA maturation endonuclease (ribonuclease M5)